MRYITRILALASLAVSLALAANYKFELSDKVSVGKAQLQPGFYSLTIDGATAILKDSAGKAIDVKGKVEQTAEKAKSTTYGLSADRQRLVSVTLRGTQTRVVFD